ncbi:hypothetical protein Enr13x_48660 [Stieleria neptunia]|uniref:Uncharacterized protein n=1 Tax=Stieleria neptunia TaxID=2527979 RepID=A0A518HVZ6_9BACT|nr:hypothetical protein [Stieleria neptunia]QDV44993.1 hypothetical protein Enr13x_48660 [Stieleria neptunia]
MAMALTEDWKEVLRLIGSHSVEDMIVGGIAVAFHERQDTRHSQFDVDRVTSALNIILPAIILPATPVAGFRHNPL